MGNAYRAVGRALQEEGVKKLSLSNFQKDLDVFAEEMEEVCYGKYSLTLLEQMAAGASSWDQISISRLGH